MEKQDEDVPLAKKPPFYAPLLWPFSYVNDGIRQPDKIKVPKPIAHSSLGPWDTKFSLAGSLRSFLLAYAVVYVLHDENNPYPAWGRGKKLGFMLQIRTIDRLKYGSRFNNMTL